MREEQVLHRLGMDRLPPGFFDDKTARQYRFHIFEDVVTRCARPRPYTDADRPTIQRFYERAEDVALYVHVPWCVEECTYCYYYGAIEKKDAMKRLLEAERAHAALMDDVMGLRGKNIPSLYFGGGTPTVLPADLLEQQLAFFTGYRMTKDAEVCVEASIGTLSDEKLDVLSRYATRLSIGIQTFDDRLLTSVSRTFSRAKALDVLARAIARIHSVNIDLLFGLRSQTTAEFLESVERAIELETPSVTLYRLEIRDDPPLVKEYEASPSSFPSEIECRLMRAEAKALLESAGYRENLVGWFLKPKVSDTKVYRERWERQTPCVAFGPHVQNYGRGHFYVNVANKDDYERRVAEGGLPIAAVHELGPLAQAHIFAMAQWKSNRAVDLASLRRTFGEEPAQRLVAATARFVDFGLIDGGADRLALTPAGASLLEWILRDVIGQLADPRVALPLVSG